MKYRNGFVSNSSSSSFIVGLPKIPSSAEELQKMMFGDRESVKYYDMEMSCKQIAERVFDDITSGKATALTKAKALEVLKEGAFVGYPIYKLDYFMKRSDAVSKAFYEEHGKSIYDEPADSPIMKKYRKLQEEEWAAEKMVIDAAAKAFLEGFWPSLKGTKPYRFEYGDDCGEGVFEHGKIFSKFHYTQVSKH